MKKDICVHPADRGLPPLVAERVPGREDAPPPLTPWGLVRTLRQEGVAGYIRRRRLAWLQTFLVAGAIFSISFGLYAGLSYNRFGQPSEDTHFVYQAHAFRQGQLHLLSPPPHGNDWASVLSLPVRGGETLRGIWLDREAGKFKTLSGDIYIIKAQDRDLSRPQELTYYVSFPPGPAVLMMPFIPAVDSPGVDLRDPRKLGLNDVQFTLFFAALNVLLFFFVLERLRRFGVSTRSTRDNVILTVLFGAGTNVLWCSILGQVWFTALVIGITFTLLYIWASIGTRHPLLAGLFLAMAFATRTPLAFSFVFFAYFLFFPDGRLRRSEWGSFLWKSVLFAAPILAVGFSLMWFNQARFDNPFEFGHTYLAQGGITRIQRYGLFNYHFLSKNLLAAFALLPRIQLYEPYVLLSKHGMSLFLTTPPLLYLLAYRSGCRPLDRKWFWALVLALAAVAVPGLFYQNTGWVQYGFRFSLDYTPYMILLLALNRRRIGWIFVTLMVVGIVVNVFGAVTFGRMEMFYEDWLIDPDR